MRVIQALQGRNTVQSAGALKTPADEVPLRAAGLFQSEDEIRHLMIDVSPTGQPVYLGDLADVERIEGEPRTLCRYNGEQAVLVSVEMLEGKNIVEFGHALSEKLEHARSALPPDVSIDVIANQPKVVDERITHFIREFGIAIGSVILVTVLLLPFRVALIASLAIPVTVCATFALMHALKVELHQVSIAALIVVLGMVVDDAIVIADNYVELLDRGVARNEAAWRSATELTVPVLTATATIIAAFLPMLLISGSVGEFISALPIAVAVSLTCSFVVAMLLTPWLCRFFIRRGLHSPGGEQKKGFSVLDLMQRSYHYGVHIAMRNKTLTLSGGVVAFVLAVVALLLFIPSRFFPTAERNQFVIHVWLPEGARLEATDAAVRRLENHLRSLPLVTAVATFVGESAPRFYYNVDPEFPAKNYAQLLVNTREADPTPALVFRLRHELEPVAPEARILVRELEQGNVMKAPIEVRLISNLDGPEDLVKLKSLAAQARAIMRATPGAEYVFDDMHEDAYELGVHVDDEVANRLGLSNYGISQQLAGGFSGMPVTMFWEGDRDVPVTLRLDERYRRTFDDVGDAYVISSLTGARVPLRSVAGLQPEWRVNRVPHRNGVRTLTVMTISDEHHLPSQVLKAARPRLEALRLGDGYRIEYGGEFEGQNDTFGEMKIVMFLSMIAIFLILLFQFRSVVQTFVIMMSIPLAIPGAVLGLLITHNPFSFTAFLGVISLSGVVVRNAIILVEYINERRAAGVELEEAALEAGERRLRPIFLTTAAAAVGVTPMILSGSSLWSPLASVIAVGLICSMFCTLLVVPVLYVVWERRFSARGPATVVALLLMCSLTMRAETRAITIDEAATLARQQNAVVKLARLKVRENERKRDQMKANALPRLTNDSSFNYTTARTKIELPAGSLGVIPGLGMLPSSNLLIYQSDRSLGLITNTLGQPVTQLIQIRAGTRAAAAEARASDEERRKAENEVALKAQEVYCGIVVLERRLKAAKLKLAAAEEARKEARDAVETGSDLEVKALEGEARFLEQSNAVLAAETQLSDLRLELNDLLGLPLEDVLELSDPGMPASLPGPVGELEKQALDANPDVRAAAALVDKARAGLRAAHADYLPEISVFAMHAYHNNLSFFPANVGTVGAKMTWNIFDWGKRAAAVGERQAQLAQAEENLNRLRSRVRITVAQSRRKVDRLADLIKVADQAVAARREAARISSDHAELGTTTALTARQAAAALAESEAQATEARAGLRLAIAELNRTLGR